MTEHEYVVIGYDGPGSATLFKSSAATNTIRCSEQASIKDIAARLVSTIPLVVDGNFKYGYKGEAIVDRAPIEFHIRTAGFNRNLSVLYHSKCYDYEYSYYVDAIYDLACWVNGWKKAPFLAPPQKLGDTKLFPGWDVALPLFPDTVGKFSGRGKLLTLFDVLDADINPADKIRIILQPGNIGYRRFAEFKRKQLGSMLKMLDMSHTAQSWARDDHKLQLDMLNVLRDLLNEPKDPQ